MTAPRVDAVALALAGAERRLLGRIQQLERRLEETGEAELWTSWIEVISRDTSWTLCWKHNTISRVRWRNTFVALEPAT